MKIFVAMAAVLLSGCLTNYVLDSEAWLEGHQSCDYWTQGEPVACDGNVPDLEAADSLDVGALCLRAYRANDHWTQVWYDVRNDQYAIRVFDDSERRDYFGVVSGQDGRSVMDWQAASGQYVLFPPGYGDPAGLDAMIFTLTFESDFHDLNGLDASVDFVDDAGAGTMIFHVGDQYHFSALGDAMIPTSISMLSFQYDWYTFPGFGGNVAFEMEGSADFGFYGIQPGACLV